MSVGAPAALRGCLWQEDAAFPAPGPGEVPSRVDAAVVGAGITGLRAARTLAEAGLRVAVLEAGRIGTGASAVNGGTVSVGTSGSVAWLARTRGAEMARAYRELGFSAVETVLRLAEEMPVDCHVQRGGRLKVALKAKHMKGLEAAAAGAAELGRGKFELLGPHEVREEAEVAGAHGGLREPYSATLHPGRYLAGLAHMAMQAGAVIHEDTPVTAIARDGGEYGLKHARGSLRADKVVLAVNGHDTGVCRDHARRVFPVGSQIIATAPLEPEVAARLARYARTYSTSLHFMNYWRLTPDGRLLFGGRQDLSTNVPPDAAAPRMIERLNTLLPASAQVAVTHAWGGRLGFTFARMPFVRKCEGLVMAGGYCGHGLPIATVAGEVAGAAALERAAPHPLLGDVPAAPVRVTRPWFLPAVGAWYRLRDRLG